MKKNEPKALCEVWEWKEKAYKDVEHMPIGEAVKKRLEDSLQTIYKLGLPLSKKGDESGIFQAK